MLTIAVTGPLPSEVSSTIQDFAQAALDHGRSVHVFQEAPKEPEILVVDAPLPAWSELTALSPRLVVFALPNEPSTFPEPTFTFPASASSVEQMLQIASERPDWERVGLYGAGTGGIEMTAGSALHTARVPLAGLILSTAQTAVMIVAADGLVNRQRVTWVAFISTGLKALSPSGSRIGPMIGITTQGLLFAFIIRVLGWNALSVSLAGGLIAAWAGAQGFLIYYLLLGGSIERAYDEITKWVKSQVHLELPALIAVVTGVLIFHALVGALVSFLVWKRPTRAAKRMERWMSKGGRPTSKRSKIPWTLVAATLLVSGILLTAGRPGVEVTLVILRALGVGLILFAVAQRWDPVKLLGYLQRTGRWGQAYALSSAIASRRRQDD